jgi:hypothetical protein
MIKNTISLFKSQEENLNQALPESLLLDQFKTRECINPRRDGVQKLVKEFGLIPSLSTPPLSRLRDCKKRPFYTPISRSLDTITNKVPKDTFSRRNGLRQAVINRGKRVFLSDPDLGSRIMDCGRIVYCILPDCEHTMKAKIYLAKHCGSRLCPYCCKRRSEKLVHLFAPVLEKYVQTENLHAYFITFTKRDTLELPDPKLLKGWYRNIFRSSFWNPYGLEGWLKTREVSIGKNSGLWHVHDHALVLLRNIIPPELFRMGFLKPLSPVYQALSDAWLKVTGGDSFVINIQKFDGNYYELFKYMTKSTAEMNDTQLAEFVHWQKGQHFFSRGGKLWKNSEIKKAFKESEDLDHVHRDELQRCPVCGAPPTIMKYYQWNFEANCYEYWKLERVKFNDTS